MAGKSSLFFLSLQQHSLLDYQAKYISVGGPRQLILSENRRYGFLGFQLLIFPVDKENVQQLLLQRIYVLMKELPDSV